MSSAVDVHVATMLSRTPRTVGLDDTLRFVRDLMAAEGIHHVVVVDDGVVVGIVSDRDVLSALSPLAENDRLARLADVATLGKRVHQIMSRHLVTVGPEAPMAEAVAAMLEHGVHSVPVTDEQRRCVGVVTSVDAMRWALRLAAEPRAAAGPPPVPSTGVGL
jgi:acetoin utilization protein AcuB